MADKLRIDWDKFMQNHVSSLEAKDFDSNQNTKSHLFNTLKLTTEASFKSKYNKALKKNRDIAKMLTLTRLKWVDWNNVQWEKDKTALEFLIEEFESIAENVWELSKLDRFNLWLLLVNSKIYNNLDEGLKKKIQDLKEESEKRDSLKLMRKSENLVKIRQDNFENLKKNFIDETKKKKTLDENKPEEEQPEDKTKSSDEKEKDEKKEKIIKELKTTIEEIKENLKKYKAENMLSKEMIDACNVLILEKEEAVKKRKEIEYWYFEKYNKDLIKFYKSMDKEAKDQKEVKEEVKNIAKQIKDGLSWITNEEKSEILSEIEECVTFCENNFVRRGASLLWRIGLVNKWWVFEKLEKIAEKLNLQKLDKERIENEKKEEQEKSRQEQEALQESKYKESELTKLILELEEYIEEIKEENMLSKETIDEWDSKKSEISKFLKDSEDKEIWKIRVYLLMLSKFSEDIKKEIQEQEKLKKELFDTIQTHLNTLDELSRNRLVNKEKHEAILSQINDCLEFWKKNFVKKDDDNLDLENVFARLNKIENELQEYTNKQKEKSESKEKQEIKEYFFVLPEESWSFKLTDSETKKDDIHHFKIELKDWTKEGILSYLSSIWDKTAINDLKSYLEPVCNIKGVENYRIAKKVKLIKPGKMKLIGEMWVLIEKAEIELITDNSEIEDESESKESIEEESSKIYYSIPEDDWTFINRDKVEESGKASYYIECELGSNKWKLVFIPSDNDRATIDKRMLMLQPACEIENTNDAYNSSITKIEMISPGEVQKEWESWKVTKKVKIKFV